MSEGRESAADKLLSAMMEAAGYPVIDGSGTTILRICDGKVERIDPADFYINPPTLPDRNI